MHLQPHNDALSLLTLLFETGDGQHAAGVALKANVLSSSQILTARHVWAMNNLGQDDIPAFRVNRLHAAYDET